MGCASSTPMVATAGSDMLKAASHVASDAAKSAEDAVQDVKQTLGKTIETAKDKVGTAVTGIAHNLGNTVVEQTEALDEAKNNLLERLHLYAGGGAEITHAADKAEASTVSVSRAPTPPPDLDSLKTSTPEPEIEKALANMFEDSPPTPKPTLAELEKLTAEAKQTIPKTITTTITTAAAAIIADGNSAAQMPAMEDLLAKTVEGVHEVTTTAATAASEPAVDKAATLAVEKRPNTTEWEQYADTLSHNRKFNPYNSFKGGGGGKFRRFGPPTHPREFPKSNDITHRWREDDSCQSDAYNNSLSSPQHSNQSSSPIRRRIRLPLGSVVAANAKRQLRANVSTALKTRALTMSRTSSPMPTRAKVLPSLVPIKSTRTITNPIKSTGDYTEYFGFGGKKERFTVSNSFTADRIGNGQRANAKVNSSIKKNSGVKESSYLKKNNSTSNEKTNVGNISNSKTNSNSKQNTKVPDFEENSASKENLNFKENSNNNTTNLSKTHKYIKKYTQLNDNNNNNNNNNKNGNNKNRESDVASNVGDTHVADRGGSNTSSATKSSRSSTSIIIGSKLSTPDSGSNSEISPQEDYLEDDLDEHLGTNLNNNLQDNLNDNLADNLDVNLDNNLYDSLADNLESSFGQNLDYSLSHNSDDDNNSDDNNFDNNMKGSTDAHIHHAHSATRLDRLPYSLHRPYEDYRTMGRSATMMTLPAPRPTGTSSFRSSPRCSPFSIRKNYTALSDNKENKAVFVPDLSSVVGKRASLTPSPYKIRARCAVCSNKYVIK